MLGQNPIIPNMVKSINSSFRQPPVLQNPQGVDGSLIIVIPSYFRGLLLVLKLKLLYKAD